MGLENQTINLPIGEVNNPSPTFNMGRIIIGQSLKDAIYSSSYTISEISDHINVSENTIRRWSNGGFKYIRKGNLRSLAELLDKKIVFERETVEFEDAIAIQTETDNLNFESENMTLLAEDIIKDLRADKTDLRERISVLKEENSALLTAIKSLESRMDDLISKTPIPITLSLDHNRMQFIVNTEKLSFVNTTQKYADIYGKNAFDVVNDCKWVDLVCEEDIWRLPIIHANSLDSSENNIKTTWKICSEHSKSKKNLYFETTAVVLDEKGVFKKIDFEPSNAVKWVETNEYYKSFPTLKE